MLHSVSTSATRTCSTSTCVTGSKETTSLQCSRCPTKNAYKLVQRVRDRGRKVLTRALALEITAITVEVLAFDEQPADEGVVATLSTATTTQAPQAITTFSATPSTIVENSIMARGPCGLGATETTLLATVNPC